MSESQPAVITRYHRSMFREIPAESLAAWQRGDIGLAHLLASRVRERSSAEALESFYEQVQAQEIIGAIVAGFSPDELAALYEDHEYYPIPLSYTESEA